MQPKESISNRHFYISLVKSVVRVAAGLLLLNGSFSQSGALFVAAEILGIIEEL